MATYLQASSGPCSTFVPEITRRSANYHPNIWGDQFLKYSSFDLSKTDANTKEHFRQLKEEVKKMLVDAAPNQQLNLIDDIQRLGVAYQFEAEIDAALQRMNVIFQGNDDDLHTVSLRFRLLRQHGYNVSFDVFRKFMDTSGKFKECLISDLRGMLSLYEATHFRVHGEDILEDALEFITSHLERLKSHLKNPLAAQVVRALKCPIHKGLNRLEAKHYISIYQQEDDSHNKVLLNLAKLDFNLLQKMHQGELSHITRWWKELNFAKKLPFARDRVVECYFWILGVYFEPQYLIARRFLTKIIAMASVADDIYDVYGTLEELVILTDAIERWDMGALDQIPECMRVYYRALLDVYTEMEEEMAKTGRPSYRVHYAKEAYKELVRQYLAEAKWFQEDYVPTLEEYLRVALVSGGYKMLATHSFVGMGDLATKEAFDWVSNNPLIVKASSVICRLSDDMVGHEVEHERGDVASAVECYMKQYGVTKQEVYIEFQKQITNAWKDMNQECLHPTTVTMPLLTVIFNMTRVINLLYDEEDGYTNSNTRTKDFITSVLIDPVQI
uniref:Beta-caryophyllene synthase n=1 Tax=Eleutherococcus sieboldianus TaxID=257409 RepID=A0A3G9E9Z8_9APIA|nr:beta-caryophyllene synthase [Eleutherococcus sieboldianus]